MDGELCEHKVGNFTERYSKSAKEWKSNVIKQLIHKIEIGQDRVKIRHYSLAVLDKKGPSNPLFFKNIGSRTLQSGGPGWTRTNDPVLIRDVL